MFKNPKVFHRVMNLENDHVIPLLEYIIGTYIHTLISCATCVYTYVTVQQRAQIQYVLYVILNAHIYRTV